MKNSRTIKGLRFQKYDTGQVHIHDDANGIKFEADAKEFKKDVQESLKELKKTDGVSIIEGGTNVKLYLLKDGKNLCAFVANDKSTEKEIETFIRTL